jgi:uncharacterized protein involved in copper resistance
MTWARLLLLPPLVSAALVVPAAAAVADDTGHDHSTMDHSTMEHGTVHDHDTMEHRTLDMDYGTGTTHSHEHATESTTGHTHPAAPKDRPLGLVLGTFGGVNGAVVLGAAVIKRRERAARLAKQARRTQGRAIPAEVSE